MIARLVAFVIPLGIDTFVVAAALGLSKPTARQRVRIGALFAGFEGGMPIIGLLLGAPLGHVLGAAAEYIAIAVLIGLGLYMTIHDDDDNDGARQLATARGVHVLLLGLSISLDELAVGFTLGLLRVPVVPFLIAVTAQAFVLSQLGLAIGHRLTNRFRETAERLAGITLAGLGAVLLTQRLAS
ncbi:MAG TPA: manganese efflux pump [Acidothermaceae bacterium]